MKKSRTERRSCIGAALFSELIDAAEKIYLMLASTAGLILIDRHATIGDARNTRRVCLWAFRLPDAASQYADSNLQKSSILVKLLKSNRSPRRAGALRHCGQYGITTLSRNFLLALDTFLDRRALHHTLLPSRLGAELFHWMAAPRTPTRRKPDRSHRRP